MQITKKSFNHMLQINHEAQISRNNEQFWDIESYSTNKTSNFDILPPQVNSNFVFFFQFF